MAARLALRIVLWAVVLAGWAYYLLAIGLPGLLADT